MAITRNKEIRSAASPDNLAVETILEVYWSRICRSLFSLLGDWDEAEDLALETFLRWHQQPPRDTTNPGGWLYRVATHLGLNALRARQRRQHYETLAEAPGLETDPADLAAREQEAARVREILSQLKPRSAQILLLRHSGMSYAEIARELAVAQASVGSLLARATQEFESLYRNLEGD
ncbi:MAG TPA: sigma-70 family RNA polymerase sigma factor [Anaerolineales bacterium]|nr:sigma-70 family RNA polymerase sigma factor [Anaerolineales bacterium]